MPAESGNVQFKKWIAGILESYVILSGVTASLREAVAQSKDPYELLHTRARQRLAAGILHNARIVALLGVLRLHHPIRKRMGWLRSG